MRELEKHFRVILELVVILAMAVILTGCAEEDTNRKKVRDLNYAVVPSTEVPEELAKLIEEKKTADFKMTYSDEKNLFIIIGYGKKETGGYSITLNELYLAENGIVIDTDLIAPGREEAKSREASYPYLVVKTEYLEDPVIFQ